MDHRTFGYVCSGCGHWYFTANSLDLHRSACIERVLLHSVDRQSAYAASRRRWRALTGQTDWLGRGPDPKLRKGR